MKRIKPGPHHYFIDEKELKKWRGWNLTNPDTHSGIVIKAMRELGPATTEKIVAKVMELDKFHKAVGVMFGKGKLTKKKELQRQNFIRHAVLWILWDLANRRQVIKDVERAVA